MGACSFPGIHSRALAESGRVRRANEWSSGDTRRHRPGVLGTLAALFCAGEWSSADGRPRRASDDLPMPSAYFKFLLEQFGTTRALRVAILDGTGVDPEGRRARRGDHPGQQLRQSRNVNAVAPPGWGLAVGARLGSVSHGSLSFGAVSAPTLRDALELLVRFGHVRDPCFGFRLRHVGRDVRIEIHERIDLRDEERVPEIENLLLGTQALVESMLGRKLEKAKVEVAARPAHADLYRRYFSGTVRFAAAVSALVIPASWLDHPSPFADVALHEVSVLKLEAMAERLKGKRYTAALVAELMASGAQGGRSLDEVAGGSRCVDAHADPPT